MPKITVKEHEHFEAALRRFKRVVESSGIIQEVRSRQEYEKPTAKRKRKQASAVKRTQKRLASESLPPKIH